MFFSDRFKKKIDVPKRIDQQEKRKEYDQDLNKALENEKRAVFIMSKSRKERRAIGRLNNHIKIPGINKPYVRPKEEK